MRYLSTRGEAPVLNFEDTLLTGLADDGGLYLPESWPRFSPDDFRAMAGLDYPALAARVIAPYVEGWIETPELEEMARQAYAGFAHSAIVPLVQSGDNDWLLELFHGPTLAFKDMALQLLGRLFDRALERRDRRITVVGATSGDTGSAAIAGLAGRERIDIVILYPHGRVSEVQRRQMTTVDAANVRCVAVEGTFDDCQALLKSMFADRPFRERIGLAAVNSINWARVMAQAAYYVAAAVRLGAPDREIAFSVPSANFGAAFAGYVAKSMGLPIHRMVIATNANDILSRFLDSGEYRTTGVTPTLSPSMDIQVSSNFERLLFEVHGRDATATRALMARLKQSGGFSVEGAPMAATRDLMVGYRSDDDGIRAEIARMARETGIVIDPHTACGSAAARQVGIDPAIPVVTHAQAHPAKFPDAVEAAIGRRPAVPERLERVMHLPEHVTVLPNDLAAVQAFITRA